MNDGHFVIVGHTETGRARCDRSVRRCGR